ncbi:MAG: IMS domain-containing protein [Vulcanococcus sp.]
MELPIDHFRLLGVSPTTDGQTVLRTLQQRLDRAPDQGFTHDALQARAELLRASAELLSDDERRQDYERELTSIADSAGAAIAGLEIPPSREVGGLLLLMEAGQAQEAFEAASRGLQPPQAPALGSSREADLTLLAGLAAEAAALDYRNQRHYETAARTLQQGLQLLQRMGQLPDQRRRLEQELSSLQPFRVLDLISRDLGAGEARQEGIGLLDQLVQRRGGLEGEGDPAFPAPEFNAFFHQIRAFLTVQEQLDLFGRWSDSGSAAATSLAAIAQTASGFVQRKPERIQAALVRLQARPLPGQELVMAYQLLLLGRVEEARALREQAAAAGLCPRSTAAEEEALAELCAGCRDWLQQAVLPNARDIAAEEADLEAWFADRDVQAYIEQQDRIRSRQSAASAPAAGVLSGNEPPFTALDPAGNAGLPNLSPAADDDLDADDDLPELWSVPPFWRHWRRPDLSALAQPPRWAWATGLAVGVAALAGGSWWALRPSPQPRAIPVQPIPSPPPAAPPAVVPELPLQVAEPSDSQLRDLLNAWLEAKGALLAGEPSSRDLQTLARPALVSALERQLAENRARGERERMEASITSLTVTERRGNRLAAAVVLRYSDARLTSTGTVLSRTPSRELHNVYVFGRDGDTWRLVAFRPGP